MCNQDSQEAFYQEEQLRKEKLENELKEKEQYLEKYVNKEEFLNQVFGIPGWVKTSRDLLKFLVHIQYRFYQVQAEYNYLNREGHIPEKAVHDLYLIYSLVEKIYKESPDEWKSFTNVEEVTLFKD